MVFTSRPEAAWLLVLALVMPGVAVAQQQTRGSVYCCDDNQGRPVCGDVLPSVCFGRAYRVLSPQGSLLREIAAPLTPEEVATREAEAERQRAEETRRMRQQRLDEALLETYRGLEDIDMREARALAEAEHGVIELRRREAELIEAQEDLKLQIESHADGEVPRELATELRLVESELNAYQGVIRAKDAEKEAIRARYAADRERYRELTEGEGAR